MKYRSEIDGLRAIAVIPVIFFHAGFTLFSGGFIGVDVFFVISGYLITTIIHNEIQNNSFSIIQFYERRARRILPALFFVSLVCIPFAWLWIMPREYKDFSQSLIAVNVFSSNILFWLESDYFATASELKPLLHTWSLGVEEQFYVFFPLFLLLFRKCRDSLLLILLVIIVFLSLAIAEYGVRNFPSANFYLLPTRAWELGIGSILAITAPMWREARNLVSQILSFIGIAMITYAIFFFDESVPIPSIFGLIPVIGTALVIAYASHETIVGKVLGLKLIVGIGLISYSAYLWHQPLFAFAKIRLVDGVSPETFIGLSACSLLLAYLTWRFIEAPFRDKNKFNRVKIFSGALVVSMSFICFGLVGHFKSGIPERLPKEVLDYSNYSNDTPTRTEMCLSEPNNFIKPPQKQCIYNSDLNLRTALWGDSHAEAIVDALAYNFSLENEALIQLTFQACPPAIGYKGSDMKKECNRFNIESLEYIKNSNIQVVVLLARWTLYFEGARFNNLEGGVESGEKAYGLPIAEDYSYIHSQQRISEVGKIYRSTIEELLNADKKVILIYPVPEVGWDVPQYLAKRVLRGSEKGENLSTSYDVFKIRSKNAYKQLDMLNLHPNLIRIYPEEIVCNTVTVGRCVAQLEMKPLYYDDDHLNSIGSEMLSKVIIKAMQKKEWLK